MCECVYSKKRGVWVGEFSFAVVVPTTTSKTAKQPLLALFVLVGWMDFREEGRGEEEEKRRR